MAKSLTTTWMWATNNGGTAGVQIHPEEMVLEWFDDAAGCACAESIGEQTIQTFREKGALVGGMPDDVREELDISLQTLAENEPQHQTI